MQKVFRTFRHNSDFHESQECALLFVLFNLGSIQVESLAFERWLDHTDADAEVAEPFAVVALDRVSLEKWLHDLQDFFLLDGAAEKLVESLTVVATAKIHVVGAV